MSSKSARVSDMLLQRLQEAHHHGSEVRIRLANSSFHGVPVHLDSEFVELLCLYVDESDETNNPANHGLRSLFIPPNFAFEPRVPILKIKPQYLFT